MTLANTATGEIVAVSPEEQTAVARLTTAIAALTDAVDFMPIADVVSIKAQVATIHTATKELGMSKEAQELAAEAVRRAEWSLRRATKKGQESGEIRSRETNLIPGARTASPASRSSSDLPAPASFFNTKDEYEDANAMAKLDAAQFDEVLDAARAEGNLSRANVARKAREASATPVTPRQQEPVSRRRPLPDAFRDGLWDTAKKVESLHRLTTDDRWPQNAEKVATARNRNDLLRIRDLLEQVITSLPETEVTP